MKVIPLQSEDGFQLRKNVELIRHNNKYYIELDSYQNFDSVVQFAISLAKENESLKERIAILEKKLKIKYPDNEAV
ncbi:MAG: hypothetical protein ACK40G_13040 [Cytophagaceae bacterium]